MEMQGTCIEGRDASVPLIGFIFLVIIIYGGMFVVKALIAIICIVPETVRKLYIDRTELGKNRRELRRELIQYIKSQGNLYYLYTSFYNEKSDHCILWFVGQSAPKKFLYKNYGFDDVSANAAEDIFSRLAKELGYVYNASRKSKYLGGVTRDSSYMAYPDIGGEGYHFVVRGSDGLSDKTVLKDIGVYSPEAWNKKINNNIGKKQNQEKTNYKKT